MKKNLQNLLAIALVFFTVNATAQNQVYWKEGFETGTFGADLGAASTAMYVTADAGTWYTLGMFQSGGTTGACVVSGGSAKHLRSTKLYTTGNSYAITPIVDFGVNEIHFRWGTSAKQINLYWTADTSATTTNWTAITSTWKTSGNLCMDTTFVINKLTAKRIKFEALSTKQIDIDSVWLTSVNQIMPVKFGAFSANQNSGLTKLNWQIETEINTGSYVIERSSNGKEFTAVGTCEAKKANNYSWIDASASNAVNYYRIKAVDKDGKFMYSNTLKVSNEKMAKAELNVAPNPVVNSALNVQLNGINKGTYNVNIYSITGALVFKSSIASEGLNCNKTIALPASVKGGNYILEIVGDNTRLTKSVLVN